MTEVLSTVIFSSIFLVAYTYALYPGVLWVLAQLFDNDRTVLTDSPTSESAPSVAVIIAAYNEQKDIEARVANVFSCDYPADQLCVYVGSDGSTDRTNAILTSIADPRLKVHAFEVNRGKPAVLNDLVATASEDILIFTDANTFFEPDAIEHLVRRFTHAEPADAVCGQLRLVKPDGVENEDNLYWKYENWLKAKEARIGCLLGANGAIYAIRREDYEPLRSDSIIDDFLIVQRIAAKGDRVDYEPNAVAVEEIPEQIADEFKRRARIGHGNYQTFFRHLEFLNPRYPLRAFVYLSHKVLRWFTPHLLLTCFVATAMSLLAGQFVVLFAAQVLALVAYTAWKLQLADLNRWRPLRLLMFWLDMQCALGAGFIRYLGAGTSESGSWERTSR